MIKIFPQKNPRKAKPTKEPKQRNKKPHNLL